MTTTLPTTMQALLLRKYDGHLELTELPVPTPGAGELLLQIAASPVNPSDVMFIVGQYGFRKRLPVVPGFEASGTVVAVGEGLNPAQWLGMRVAAFAGREGHGTWAQYMTTTAVTCIPLMPHVSLEQGAMSLVNPWTAYALLDIARKGHKAAVHTAAASALGRMMLRLAQQANYPLINIVRRPEQVELLQSLGAEYVLDSSDPDFPFKLSKLCRDLGATIAFDAVAGEMPSQLLHALPRGGEVVLYGALSQAAVGNLNPGDFIFGDKKVSGFWLSVWIAQLSAQEMQNTAVVIQQQLGDTLQTNVRTRPTLAAAPAEIATYTSNMTAGKVLILPNG
jgi:NADPH:quinone reductase